MSERVRDEAPPLTIEDAKSIIVAARSVYGKVPDSIRDAQIGKPYPCVSDSTDVATPPSACVCVEANAKTSLGGYTSLKRDIAYLSGGTVVDFRPPRLAMDRCEGLNAAPRAERQAVVTGANLSKRPLNGTMFFARACAALQAAERIQIENIESGSIRTSPSYARKLVTA